MRWTRVGWIGLAISIVLSLGLMAEAASSISNSLTGFTGDSTQAGTQAAVAAAGFDFYSTTGEVTQVNDNGTPGDPGDDFVEVVSNHSVVFDGSGAHFGSLIGGDGGRNYMRTIQSDYSTTNFVAEVTFAVSDIGTDQVFFGLGAGDTALFGLPDWSTQFSSASFWIEASKIVSFRTADDTPVFVDTNFAPQTVADLAGEGTHRLRMTFDKATNQLRGSMDIDYAGGPFVADVSTTFPIVVTSLIGATGWTGEPSRIFFGGDDGTTFRDFQVIVPEPASLTLLCLAQLIMAGVIRGRKR